MFTALTTNDDRLELIATDILALLKRARAPIVPAAGGDALLFPAPEGGHLDLHNWRPRFWRPAQRHAGITPR